MTLSTSDEYPVINIPANGVDPSEPPCPAHIAGAPTEEKEKTMHSSKMTYVAIAALVPLLALLWTFGSFLFKSGERVEKFATKKEIVHAVQHSHRKRAKALTVHKEHAGKARRFMRKRVRKLESKVTRIDERTKLMHEDIRSMMNHMRIRPAKTTVK